ncbi:hypothetical protein CERSUDRAFT_116990 [Gelatoporia subvermispora B]|uniref:F-box domain-containing protein n=1 Tax=Ceriporiopsis subvermispora (strain B) TaxID=914234 RepID=M2R8P6_CERS8|nr:hypothetical protein CERSUDRAFT_116990 [Gelatoporia subvermispora B]
MAAPTSTDPTTSAAATMKLPQEIYDHVVDYLWNDKPALAACSLVCHGWLHAARFHLFAECYLSTRVQYLQFRDLMHASTTSGTSVERYIRHLTIDLLEHQSPTPGLSGAYREDSCEGVLLTTLPWLHHVSHLTLSMDWAGGWLRDDLRECILRLAPRVRQLTLSTLYIVRAEDIFRMLEYFTVLTSLELIRVVEKEDVWSAWHCVKLPRSSPRIQSAYVKFFTCTPFVVELLLHSPRGAVLRKLACTLNPTVAEHWNGLQGCLRHSGASLEILQLHTNCHGKPVVSPPPLDLRSNTRLRQFTMFWSSYLPHQFNLSSFITHIASPYLRTLQVVFPADSRRSGSADIRVSDVEVVDEILTQLLHNAPDLHITIQVQLWEERRFGPMKNRPIQWCQHWCNILAGLDKALPRLRKCSRRLRVTIASYIHDHDHIHGPEYKAF